ncbi:MAG: excinuclease ABC subunit UvrA [Clostridia bacterium]|nr:excinuclease ABC subunit UvrA [Clostridia bacterium]
MKDVIEIIGAKENNLKNVNLTIPRDKLVVFTGLSGSGKSSLAFDTIFAEGQRRYMESLSSYARQFLGQMQKPNVEKIEGLSPAIAIDQKTTSANPRSTVGTVTEIYDYFRLLYAHIGTPYCVNCGTQIKSSSVDSIVQKVLAKPEGTRFLVVAPVIRNRKGEFAKMFDGFKKDGYVRVKVDGEVHTLDEDIKLDKQKKHTISVVIDRLVVKPGIESRLTESIETSFRVADELVVIDYEDHEELYSGKHSCPECGFSFTEISPRLFSFNTPLGACPECSGIGYKMVIDEDLVFKDKTKSINESGFANINYFNGDYYYKYFAALSKKYKFSLDTPICELPEDIWNIILYGNNGEQMDISFEMGSFKGEYKGSFEGMINNLYRRYQQTDSDYVKTELEKYMRLVPCKVCHGERLNKQALSVKINGLNINEVCAKSVKEVLKWAENLNLTSREEKIAHDILKEIKARCKFLIDVGLDYLTLSRTASTLSGGEAQRIRLATQIGSGLVGVAYILDEPSIGLHPRDTQKLIKTLTNLRDLGNTVIVVEHDEDTIRKADFIVDVGPKAGQHGGQIVCAGTLKDVINCEKSLTGQYLSGKRKIAVPKSRRALTGKFVEILGAKQHNLKNVDVKIPLGVFTAVTGVSGSGKSSLVNDILYPALANRLNHAKIAEGDYKEILGAENLDKVVVIDQSPIGRTPRSNPATYTGVFTAIRELFAKTPDAKAKGYTSGRFSFNVKGGRCETCGGDGVSKIEMHFLPDVYVTCDECHGKRYNRETLEVEYKGKNISDVLEMTVEEALTYFENIPNILNKIQTLYDVGLGYIKLGQPATTLSGGEAQRVKLATELSKRATGRTMYILDEPTTGLHTYDVDKLIDILKRIVAGGNSVLVIEHNLDMIKVADYIIDLGPDGGDKGGKIVATGTPEEIANNPHSVTGEFLKPLLNLS